VREVIASRNAPAARQVGIDLAAIPHGLDDKASNRGAVLCVDAGADHLLIKPRPVERAQHRVVVAALGYIDAEAQHLEFRPLGLPPSLCRGDPRAWNDLEVRI